MHNLTFEHKSCFFGLFESYKIRDKVTKESVEFRVHGWLGQLFFKCQQVKISPKISQKIYVNANFSDLHASRLRTINSIGIKTILGPTVPKPSPEWVNKQQVQAKDVIARVDGIVKTLGECSTEELKKFYTDEVQKEMDTVFEMMQKVYNRSNLYNTGLRGQKYQLLTSKDVSGFLKNPKVLKCILGMEALRKKGGEEEFLEKHDFLCKYQPVKAACISVSVSSVLRSAFEHSLADYQEDIYSPETFEAFTIHYHEILNALQSAEKIVKKEPQFSVASAGPQLPVIPITLDDSEVKKEAEEKSKVDEAQIKDSLSSMTADRLRQLKSTKKLTQIGQIDLGDVFYLKFGENYFAMNLAEVRKAQFLDAYLQGLKDVDSSQILDLSKCLPQHIFVQLTEKSLSTLLKALVVGKFLSEIPKDEAELEKILAVIFFFNNKTLCDQFKRHVDDHLLTPKFIQELPQKGTAINQAVKEIMHVRMITINRVQDVVKNNIIKYLAHMRKGIYGGAGATTVGCIHKETGEFAFESGDFNDKEAAYMRCYFASGERSQYKWRYNELIGHCNNPVGVLVCGEEATISGYSDWDSRVGNYQLYNGTPYVNEVIKIFENWFSQHDEALGRHQGTLQDYILQNGVIPKRDLDLCAAYQGHKKSLSVK